MLAIWAGMRNSGSVIGGAINFANNYQNSAAGVIRWSTYIIFIGFGKCSFAECESLLTRMQSAPVLSGPVF